MAAYLRKVCTLILAAALFLPVDGLCFRPASEGDYPHPGLYGRLIEGRPSKGASQGEIELFGGSKVGGITLRDGESVTIGRSPDASIQILATYKGKEKVDFVSRNHAKLIYRDGNLIIKDLGSGNGTFVNRKRLEPNKEYKLSLESSVVAFGPLIIDLNSLGSENYIAQPKKIRLAGASSQDIRPTPPVPSDYAQAINPLAEESSSFKRLSPVRVEAMLDSFEGKKIDRRFLLAKTNNTAPAFKIERGEPGGKAAYKVVRNNEFFEATIPTEKINIYKKILQHIINKAVREKDAAIISFFSDPQNEQYLDYYALSDFVFELAHISELGGVMSSQAGEKYIRGYIDSLIRGEENPSYTRFAMEKRKNDKPDARQVLLLDPPKRVVLSDDATEDDMADPEVMIIDTVVYKTGGGRLVRLPDGSKEALEGEKILVARWKEKWFMFYTSRTHTVDDIEVHLWRNCDFIQPGHFTKSKPENLDDIRGDLGLVLDAILYSEGMKNKEITTNSLDLAEILAGPLLDSPDVEYKFKPYAERQRELAPASEAAPQQLPIKVLGVDLIPGGSIVIGRYPEDSGLAIMPKKGFGENIRKVSREHATLIYTEEGLAIKDTSKNGTIVLKEDDVYVKLYNNDQPFPVDLTDTIIIEGFKLRLSDETQGECVLIPVTARSKASSMAEVSGQLKILDMALGRAA